MKISITKKNGAPIERYSAKHRPTYKPYLDISQVRTNQDKTVLDLCETPQDEMSQMTRLDSYLYLTWRPGKADLTYIT